MKLELENQKSSKSIQARIRSYLKDVQSTLIISCQVCTFRTLGNGDGGVRKEG